MALNIYDTASGTTTPVAGQQGFDINRLFQDRNFLSLLAGIGTGLDPKGVGGALGAPTQVAIASQAAQERAAKTAAAQNAQTKMVIEALNRYGGLTPQGAPGIDGIKSTKDGGVELAITPHSDLSGSGLETPTAVAPTAPVAGAPTTAPGAVAPTTGTVIPSAPVAPATAPTTGIPRGGSRSSIEALLPFYSALLG